MKIQTYFLGYFFVLVFISCKPESPPLSTQTIDLSSSYIDKYDINLSDIATEIEYIPLETKEFTHLSKIRNYSSNILFSKEYILIKDNSELLFLFDSSGKFIKKIGNIGNGPGEFSKIKSFTMVPEKNIIVMHLEVPRKTLIYNFKGEFLKEFSVRFLPDRVFEFNDDLIYINSVNNRKESEFYNFTVLSLEGKIKKKLLLKKDEKEARGIKTFLGGFSKNIFVLDSKLHYWEKNGFSKKDTVWSISENFEVKPEHIINTGGRKISRNRMKLNRRLSMEDHRKWCNLLTFYESSKYLFYEVLNTNADYSRLFTVKSDTISKRLKRQGYMSKKPIPAFVNDIDGGRPFWPKGKVSDNKVFTLIYGYELKQYFKNQKVSFKSFNPVNREKLLKIVNKAQITDNPILMVVTLKN